MADMDKSCREKNLPRVISLAPAMAHSMGADMSLSNVEYLHFSIQHSHPNLTKKLAATFFPTLKLTYF